MTSPSTTLGTGVTGLSLDLLAERIEHERELREAAFEAVEKARQIQFNEYERRLEALNGEAGRIRDVLGSTVPRELFDNYRADQARAITTALDVVNERRETLVRDTEGKFTDTNRSVRAVADQLQTWSGSINVLRFLAGGGGLIGIAALVIALVR